MKKVFLTILLTVAYTVSLHAQLRVGDIFRFNNSDYRITSINPNEVELDKVYAADRYYNIAIYNGDQPGDYTDDHIFHITSVKSRAFADLLGFPVSQIQFKYLKTTTSEGFAGVKADLDLSECPLTTICGYAFDGLECNTLDLSAKTLTNLAIFAFKNANVKKVILPNTFTILPERCFAQCSIEEIVCGSISQISYGCFSLCTPLRSIDLSHVQSIEEFAFQGCSSLSNVNLPQCLEIVGGDAFRLCGLKTLTMYNTTSTMGSQAGIMADDGVVTMHIVDWSNKNVLANRTTGYEFPMAINYTYDNAPVTGNYTIPNTVTTLGQGALYHAAGLTGITLPASLTKIGQHAFGKCTTLTYITSNATTPPVVANANAFAEVNKSIPVTIPDNATTYYSYRTTTGWKDFTNYQVSLQTAKDVAERMLNEAFESYSAPSIIELLSDYISQINAATSKAEVDSLYAEAINALPLAISKLECIDAVKAAAVGVVAENLQALIDGYVARINAATTVQAAEAVRDEAIAAFQLMRDKQSMLDELESMKEGVQSEAILNKIQSYIDYISNPSTTLDQARTKYDEALLKLGDLLEGYKEGEKVGKAEGAAEAYSAPTEPGMRLKVTKTDGKVYEFLVTDVESTKNYRATE